MLHNNRNPGTLQRAAVIGGTEQRMVLYPMNPASAKRGKSMINWLAIAGGQENYVKREAWDRKVPKERFFDKFAGWNFGCSFAVICPIGIMP